MKCPFCGSFDGQVLDSRPIEHTSAIRRRRQCNQCKKRYTTYERPDSCPTWWAQKKRIWNRNLAFRNSVPDIGYIKVILH